MATTLFSWDDDVQDIWETPDWTPRVELIHEMPGQVVPLLDGSRMIVRQVDGSNVPVTREGVRLSWEDAPPELLPIVEATYRAGRQVTVTYPWRGSTATITGEIPPNGWSETPGQYKSTSLEVTILEL